LYRCPSFLIIIIRGRWPGLSLSTHYYVLALGSRTNTLFEAFRDSLIDIENHGFPVSVPDVASSRASEERLKETARTVDRHFGHYFRLEPLRLVLTGDSAMMSAFDSVTRHSGSVIGRIYGDHTATPARDLGQIVWPVVKEAMSGVIDKAMADLETSEGMGRTASGLEAVVRVAKKAIKATLMVEDDYHMRGSIGLDDRAPAISPDIDVREAIDDAIDAVIEKVLGTGGNVIFTPGGSLSERNRIVLLLRDAADV
jgi:hypothetical protein